MEIALEDDPDERKAFDAGKPNCESKCADPSVELVKRCAGDAKRDFHAVSCEIDAVLASGGHALVHCHASLSRSVAFILAHLMRTKGISLLEAGRIMKKVWDATWPCDRFVMQLIEYEQELKYPHRFSTAALFTTCAAASSVGALATFLALKRP